MEVFYGESICQGKKLDTKSCTNKAYFIQKNEYLCGVHSSKFTRTKLLKNPNRFENKKRLIDTHLKKVKEMMSRNNAMKIRGSVRMEKLRMMKHTTCTDGYLNVFPNFKHQNRKDGFGCKSLSPMSLGPVVHNQPGIPIAQTIEGFHQFSKCFSSEIDIFQNPLPIFFEEQKKAFVSHLPPVRHKPTATGNIPIFFVWVDKNKVLHKLTYIESRQFYCNFYERLASQTDDFKTLQNLLANGCNLQIMGYDAFDMGSKSMEEHYLDSSKPFGHEAVLYTMLNNDEKDFPWRKYKTFEF